MGVRIALYGAASGAASSEQNGSTVVNPKAIGSKWRRCEAAVVKLSDDLTHGEPRVERQDRSCRVYPARRTLRSIGKSEVSSRPKISTSLARARLSLLLIVPIPTSQTSAASS